MLIGAEILLVGRSFATPLCLFPVAQGSGVLLSVRLGLVIENSRDSFFLLQPPGAPNVVEYGLPVLIMNVVALLTAPDGSVMVRLLEAEKTVAGAIVQNLVTGQQALG